MKDIPNVHPNIIRAMRQSEKDGGVFINKVPAGTIIKATTKNTQYIFEVIEVDRHKNNVKVQANGKFDKPTRAHVAGSTWGGSLLKDKFIGIGMYIELYAKKMNGVDISDKVLHTTSIMYIEIWKDGQHLYTFPELE